MALLRDIRNIIIPINIDYKTFNDNLDNTLENLIIYNNKIYNSFVFNHIIYNSNYESNKSEFKDKLIIILKKHINTNIKQQRIHFRNLNKQNKLDISDFNEYFSKMYNLISKLNGMFQHIIPISMPNIINHNSKNNKWGYNILWDYTINSINSILLEDVIFKYAIINNIKNNEPTNKNPHMFKLNNYMNIFNSYVDNHNIFYNNFVNYIDTAMVDYIDVKNSIFISNIELLQSTNNEINIINNDIYIFKKLYKYYMDYYSNYYYISKNKPFTKLKEYITNHIKKIFENNDIIFIKNFITIYKNEFISLIKHIDINYVLLSSSPSDIHTYISYYNTLYEISKKSNLNEIVIGCIEQNINTYFNSFEKIMHLADLINTDIINKQLNPFYYVLGSMIKNRDEFIMAICQKMMERIIYTDYNSNIEIQHKECLEIIFSSDQKFLLKYNIIQNDYIASMNFSSDKMKLIITSLDAWKINHSTGYSNTIINTEEFTTLLCNSLFKYNQMYITRNIKKKLIVYSHLGCIDIEIHKQKISVLPAHMFCLELFVDFDTNLSYDIVFNKVKQNMSNYSDEFIKKIIDSLCNDILIKNNNMLRVRTLINGPINMIDIFHEGYNNKNIIIKQMKEELCNDKIDIITTNINYHVKKYEEINIDVLYEIIIDSITIFEMNKDIFMKAINRMIKNDYIQLNDNKVKKYIFE
jgi:hypothetical protein